MFLCQKFGVDVIELSPISAVIVYLTLTLSTLLAIWVYYHYHARQKKIVVSEKKLLVCEYCLFVYLDRIEKKVTQCPQCQCYNEQ
jgi:hypothetical protein